MTDYKATETDMRISMLNRGYTEAQVAALLGEIKAKAWDEAAEVDAGCHDCIALNGVTNPYRQEQP